MFSSVYLCKDRYYFLKYVFLLTFVADIDKCSDNEIHPAIHIRSADALFLREFKRRKGFFRD